VSHTNPQSGPGASGVRMPGSHEKSGSLPSNLVAESKCHMKTQEPAQALLGAESQGPMKIQKPARALWRLIPQPSACFCFSYVFGDLSIFQQEQQTAVGWLPQAGPQTESARNSAPVKLNEKWASKS
jgi:hypothetical protein